MSADRGARAYGLVSKVVSPERNSVKEKARPIGRAFVFYRAKRAKVSRPRKRAVAPSSSSIRISWLYFGDRSPPAASNPS
jgi:hypothetical protein